MAVPHVGRSICNYVWPKEQGLVQRLHSLHTGVVHFVAGGKDLLAETEADNGPLPPSQNIDKHAIMLTLDLKGWQPEQIM